MTHQEVLKWTSKVVDRPIVKAICTAMSSDNNSHTDDEVIQDVQGNTVTDYESSIVDKVELITGLKSTIDFHTLQKDDDDIQFILNIVKNQSKYVLRML